MPKIVEKTLIKKEVSIQEASRYPIISYYNNGLRRFLVKLEAGKFGFVRIDSREHWAHCVKNTPEASILMALSEYPVYAAGSLEELEEEVLRDVK